MFHFLESHFVQAANFQSTKYLLVVFNYLTTLVRDVYRSKMVTILIAYHLHAKKSVWMTTRSHIDDAFSTIKQFILQIWYLPDQNVQLNHFEICKCFNLNCKCIWILVENDLHERRNGVLLVDYVPSAFALVACTSGSKSVCVRFSVYCDDNYHFNG